MSVEERKQHSHPQEKKKTNQKERFAVVAIPVPALRAERLKERASGVHDPAAPCPSRALSGHVCGQWGCGKGSGRQPPALERQLSPCTLTDQPGDNPPPSAGIPHPKGTELSPWHPSPQRRAGPDIIHCRDAPYPGIPPSRKTPTFQYHLVQR